MNKAALAFSAIMAGSTLATPVEAHDSGYPYERYEHRHNHRHGYQQPRRLLIDSFRVCARTEYGTGPYLGGDFTVSAYNPPRYYNRESIIRSFLTIASESYADDIQTGYLNGRMRSLESRIEARTGTDITWSYGLFADRQCTRPVRGMR